MGRTVQRIRGSREGGIKQRTGEGRSSGHLDRSGRGGGQGRQMGKKISSVLPAPA